MLHQSKLQMLDALGTTRALRMSHHRELTFSFGFVGKRTSSGGAPEIYSAIIDLAPSMPTFRRIFLSHFPNMSFEEGPLSWPNQKPSAQLFFKTSKPECLLTCFNTFQPHPLAIMVNAFEDLHPGEAAAVLVQLLVRDTLTEQTSLTVRPGFSGLWEDMEEKKRADLLWLSQLQFLAFASPQNTAALSTAFHRYLGQFTSPDARFERTERHADPNLLGTNEIVGLVHLPHRVIPSPLLLRANSRERPVPELLTHDEGITLGVNKYREVTTSVILPHDARDRHCYVIGKSGTGKSTLLFNLARQDIEQGSGVGVIDPHGDLVEELLNFVPKHRILDTIYFNAADRERPIALNVMDAASEDEIGLLADDLLVTFRRLSDTWGERMESILRYTFHTLLRVPGSTLLDVNYLLQSEHVREKMLAKVTFPPLLQFWRDQFPLLSKDAIQPILSRMSKFVLSPTLHSVLGQQESRLNFFDVLQNRKILLVNLSVGKIGEDNAKLLGSLITSQIQLSVMRRAHLAKEERIPFFLYVDEFQNFTTSAFDRILSEARKYRLCLTLAHQYISQLDEKIRNSILGNVGTIVMFPLGSQDAHYLRAELGAFEPEDLLNLSTQEHEALCKPPTSNRDTFKFRTLPPPSAPFSFAKEIIEHTRAAYSAVSESKPPTPRQTYEEPTEEPKAAAPERRHPAPAAKRDTAAMRDRILTFMNLAEYLSTQQIIELCYSHLATSAKAPAASRDLKSLVEDKSLRVQPFGRGNIYYTARTCNPTTHNLAIRDLLVKIIASGFAIAEVNFKLDLKVILPDLYVGFLSPDGKVLKTLWEYDTGTEGVAEIVKKVARYKAYPEYSPIVCVVRDRDRLAHLQTELQDSSLWFAVMDDFTTLKDPAFHLAGERPRPLFEIATAAASPFIPS